LTNDADSSQKVVVLVSLAHVFLVQGLLMTELQPLLRQTLVGEPEKPALHVPANVPSIEAVHVAFPEISLGQTRLGRQGLTTALQAPEAWQKRVGFPW
jgi:hypothetical protein